MQKEWLKDKFNIGVVSEINTKENVGTFSNPYKDVNKAKEAKENSTSTKRSFNYMQGPFVIDDANLGGPAKIRKRWYKETIERVNDKGKKIKIQPQLHHHLFDFLMEKFPSDKDVKKFVTTFSNGEKKVVIDRLEDPWLPSVACWEASNEDFIRMEEVDYMKLWYHDIVRGWKRPRFARSPVTVPKQRR